MNRTSPRSILFSSFILFFLTQGEVVIAQHKAVHPSIIKKADSFGQVSNLKTNNHFSPNSARQQHKEEGDKQIINSGILPQDFSNKPRDPGEQRQITEVSYSMKITSNFPGQSTDQGINPSDANGDVNENYYVQVINSKLSVYNKATSASVLGPLPLNNLFNQALPGANLPIRDPTVLWDEHAGKWVFSGFSENKTPFLTTDYILLAVSVSSDPTGLWNSWSFIADGKPDYPKLGIWRDGYYMGTRTNYGSDIYVFERDAMIAGELYPQMIKFDHAVVETPNTWNLFSCLLPLDNDGSWAPDGTPGQFITIADDDQNNPLDALYIYELSVDWSNTQNSTFVKTQELEVNPFWGNFDTAYGAVPQKGTNTKLSPNSTVLMHRAQYRNFDGTQKIVCTHTIGEAADQTAIRWYELEKIGTEPWGIRQQGTFNPASSLYIFSRWNASIAMNDLGEIALAYSISGTNTFPGIRCCGQSKSAPLNTMDIGETTIFDGTLSSTAIHFPYRWGDYANMAVDPSDGVTFWFTSEYVKDNSGDDVIKGTQIASLRLGVWVDQSLSYGNTHIRTVGRWNGNQFTESPVPSLFYFPDDESQVLKGYQDVVANEKYSYWKINKVVDNDVVNYKNIQISPNTTDLVSQFNPAKNATLQCLFENSVSAYTLSFKDPWFIDYADPLYNNVLRNRGMKNFGDDALIFQPVAYSANNLGTNSSHKGVFLLQDYLVPGKPYYSAKAEQTPIIPIGGVNNTFYFQNWSGTGVEFENANTLETRLVFTDDNAVATANYKGHLLSNNSTNFSTIGQRKIVAEPFSSNRHLVYESLGYIWYSRSTNNGVTWLPEIKISDEGTQAKGASIAVGNGYTYILYQSDHNTYNQPWPTLILCKLSSSGSRLGKTEVYELGTSPSAYNYNTMAAVAVDLDHILVVLKPNATSGLVGREILVNHSNFALSSLINVLEFTETTQYSVNPSIAIKYGASVRKYMLVYQESYGTIYYKEWDVASNLASLITTNLTTGSPYSINNSPSIVSFGIGGRVCWIGSAAQYSAIVFRDIDPGSSQFWSFGFYASSPSINATDNNTAYFLGWKENGTGFKIVDNHLTNTYMKTLTGLQGNAIQLSSGIDANAMYAMTFNNASLPYALTPSNSLGSYYQVQRTPISKENALSAIASGRAGVVIKDAAQFYFMLGDIEVNGEKIRFKQLSDTLRIPSMDVFNTLVESEPFELKANSSFTYSVEYGVTDSLRAFQLLQNYEQVKFNIEVVDAANGQLMGTLDPVTYSKDYLKNYCSMNYEINAESVNPVMVKLRLKVNHSGNAVYSITDRYYDVDPSLAKKTFKTVILNDNLKVMEYALTQNYPNPFNPTTTINYQLPKAGHVILKIYDVLGNEVKTLVNEMKEMGKYTATFDASKLASGMYVYQIKANDYTSTKKLMLLK